jgi:PEGA domain
VTGAPIYLVSACTSGEEFVAAFRRYADKNGLFVPIGEPLPLGGRGRFAVTLKDGGVMIEGEAEIVSSARTATVLHGRVGMTLRFLEPDEASKTMLAELEKARLAMRPAPPSVAPRPAEIPAEPRPVPPPVAGRIDAVNALAECVSIGDLGALGPAAAAAAAAVVVAPPKAGPRFVMPALPAVGVAPRPATSPVPVIAGKPDVRGERAEAMPPSITPRAAPQPEQVRKGPERRSEPAEAVPSISGFSQTMTAVAPLLDPGPTSETMTAAVPPAPPAPPAPVAPALRPLPSAAPRRAVEMAAAVPHSITRPGPAQAPPSNLTSDRAASDTMDAVPGASMILPSAPTDVGGVLVDPLPPLEAVVATLSQDDASARTQVHAGAPPAPPPPPTSATSSSPSDSITPIMPTDSITPTTRTVPVAPTGSIKQIEPIMPTDSITPTARTAPIAPTDSITPITPTASTASITPAAQPAASDASARRTPSRAELAPTLRGPILDLLQPQRSGPPGLPELPDASAPGDNDPDDAELDPSGGATTHIGMPPIPRAATPASPLPAVLRPAPPIVAPERPPVPEVEIAEPTDLSVGPPEPPGELLVEAPMELLVEPSGEILIVPPIKPPIVPPPRHAGAAPPEPPTPRPRKTEIGVAVVPSGVMVLPATVTAPRQDARGAGDLHGAVEASLIAADEVTSIGGRVGGGNSSVAVTAPTARPEPSFPGRVDDATPGRGGILPPASAAPPSMPGTSPPSPPTSVPPGAGPGPLPTGDWTIALDPQAPDGWSEPFEAIPAEPFEAPSASPPPGSLPPPAVVASPPPRDPVPKRPTPPAPHREELPIAEPKVQIDPTLIEPLRPMPPEPQLRPMPSDMPLRPVPPDDPFRHAAASSGSMPIYEVPLGVQGTAAPAMAMMPPGPMPHSFLVPSGPQVPHAGEVPAYPMDPSYQMVPLASPLSAGGSGMGDPRYASDTALPVRPGRRRLVIVLVSALVAVVIGIVALVVFGGKGGPGTPDTKVDAPRPPTEPPKPAKAPPAATAPSPAAPATAIDPGPPPPSRPAGAPAAVPGNVTTGSGTPAGAAPPETTTCFAEVSSVPVGAEIVIGPTTVVGTTPQKLTLPCGDKVEVSIRKARFVPATRTITPTPDGVKLKVALAKQMFLVKVSSTPAGATITMNGKSLGVTPTTVKVPQFEASTLTIAKDGYGTETEKVTPKSNGVAVHTTLKKLDRKKPR